MIRKSVLAMGVSLVTAVPFTVMAQNSRNAVDQVNAYVSTLFDENLTTIEFENGSAKISKEADSKLREIAERSRNDERIDDLIVAVWSDQDYPAAEGQKLASNQEKIADERVKRIKDALKKYDAEDVDVYSMAEKPSWISKAFNTQGALIKDKGRTITTTDKVEAEIGRKIRAAGGPGKAVLVLKLAQRQGTR